MNLAMNKLSSRTLMKLSLVLGTCFSLMLLPDSVLAQATAFGGCDNKIYYGLSQVLLFLNGGVARTIAVLAVMAFGIGALTGRVDWIKALQLVLAVGIIFSAATIVKVFAEGDDKVCATS